MYSSPSVTQPQPASQPAKSAEPEQPQIEMPSSEPGPNEKGEWRKVPVNPESLQLFKGVKSLCKALSKIVQGLGSAQLFAGADGQTLNQSFGPQAESLARSLDQQLFDMFKPQLGSGAADCPSPSPARKSSLGEPLHAPRIELHYLIHPTNETERLYTMVNYQCVPGELVSYPFFYALYAVSHGAEEINLLKGWTYVGRNGVVATKVLRGICGDYCEDESVFTLKEADGPPLNKKSCKEQIVVHSPVSTVLSH